MALAPSSTTSETTWGSTPDYRARCALIRTYLLDPITTLYEPPLRMRDKPDRQRTFIAELTEACVRELPDRPEADLQYLLQETKREFVGTYARGVWPVPGAVAEVLRRLVKDKREIDRDRLKALPAPKRKEPEIPPTTLDELRRWWTAIAGYEFESTRKPAYGLVSAWVRRHGVHLDEGTVCHDAEQAWKAAGMKAPPKGKSGGSSLFAEKTSGPRFVCQCHGLTWRKREDRPDQCISPRCRMPDHQAEGAQQS